MLNGYEETEREIMATLETNMAVKSSQTMNSSLGAGQTNTSTHLVVSTGSHHNQVSIQQQQQQPQTYYYSSRFMVKKPKSRFRTGVICVIAISRIK